MTVFLHDGTFEGFLTCIYQHYYEERASSIHSIDEYQNTMLNTSRIIKTETDKAVRVYEAIEEKISKHALKRVYYVFLSSVQDKDNIAFEYVRLGFKMGRSISSLHSHQIVFNAEKAAKKVTVEAHRLNGLVRFSSIKKDDGVASDEILYSKIQPDHDVLELLGDHFADRFKYEPFIIHDVRRSKGLFSHGGNWLISALSSDFEPDLSICEKQYRGLWKQYFDSIAIEQRVNPSCQKRMMPVRYWKNLTEMSLPDLYV